MSLKWVRTCHFLGGTHCKAEVTKLLVHFRSFYRENCELMLCTDLGTVHTPSVSVLQALLVGQSPAGTPSLLRFSGRFWSDDQQTHRLLESAQETEAQLISLS